MIEFSPQEKRIVIFLLVSFLGGLGVSYYRTTRSMHALDGWHKLQQERLQTFEAINFAAPSEEGRIKTDYKLSKEESRTRKEALLKKIDINRATSEQLQTLERIGPVLAQRIILYREKNGAFKSIDELLQVEGIGPKTFEKIKTNICISDSTKK